MKFSIARVWSCRNPIHEMQFIVGFNVESNASEWALPFYYY